MEATVQTRTRSEREARMAELFVPFDITVEAIIAHVEPSNDGLGETPHVAAFRAIAEHSAAQGQDHAVYHFPVAGGNLTVSIDFQASPEPSK